MITYQLNMTANEREVLTAALQAAMVSQLEGVAILRKMGIPGAAEALRTGAYNDTCDLLGKVEALPGSVIGAPVEHPMYGDALEILCGNEAEHPAGMANMAMLREDIDTYMTEYNKNRGIGV